MKQQLIKIIHKSFKNNYKIQINCHLFFLLAGCVGEDGALLLVGEGEGVGGAEGQGQRGTPHPCRNHRVQIERPLALNLIAPADGHSCMENIYP